jgi:hypothetical protein
MSNRTLLVVSVLATILGAVLLGAALLAACGGDEQVADPFVGTWREVGDATGTPVIIAKTNDDYVATVVYRGPDDKAASPRPAVSIPLTKDGDKLVGTYESPSGSLRLEITYLPDSGHTTWANSRTPDGPLNAPDELEKVSESTTIPSSAP